MNKFDINNLVVDKVQTVYHGYIKCPVCGFDNSEMLHECPACNFELIGKTITLCEEERKV